MELSGTVCDQLNARLGRRGWHFREVEGEVRGRQQDWAPQVEVVVDPGDSDRLPAMGIAIDFGLMPLGGERFRDVLNAEREEIFLTYGSFRLRQLRDDGRWAPEISHRAFVHGYGSGTEISRHTLRAIFDRCPTERGTALVERVVQELNKIAEAGGNVALLLQRIYQRTVLRQSVEAHEHLPELVGHEAPKLSVLGGGPGAFQVAAEAAYPWRR